MKIVLVGNYPADKQASMLRYQSFLERELGRAGHNVRIIYPRVIAHRLVRPENRIGKWLGYIDKFLLFRIGFSRKIGDADIVHVCDHSNSPYLRWIRKTPKAITCHDALAIRSALGHFPANVTRGTGKILQLWIRTSIRHADRIVYVSEKTRFDFEQLLGIEVPSEVIPHTLNWPYSVALNAEVSPVLQRYGLEKRGYILHVGGDSWYKNRLGALQMYARLRREGRFQSLRMVTAGRPLSSEIYAWCRENNLMDVVELSNVSNEELRILYSGAAALLFPSWEEGFGWPVLEAQACGCPVITSNRPPMSEIAGDGAILIDPARHESIHEAVSACIDNRDALVNAGFRNLEKFSLHEVIRKYEVFYRHALNG